MSAPHLQGQDPRLLAVAGQSRIEVKIQGFAEAQLGEIRVRRVQQEIAFSRDQGTRHLEYRRTSSLNPLIADSPNFRRWRI